MLISSKNYSSKTAACRLMCDHLSRYCGLPRWRGVKNLPANAGDSRDKGSIPGPGSSPGKGNSNLLQYPCLGKLMDKGAWQITAHGVTKESDTTEHTHTC